MSKVKRSNISYCFGQVVIYVYTPVAGNGRGKRLESGSAHVGGVPVWTNAI